MMKRAKAIVEPGACGFTVIIIAEFNHENLVNISFDSGCKHIIEMQGEFINLNWKKGVFGKMIESSIYQICSKYLKHVDCPIPSAILKTIRVLIDAAVDQNVSMKVVKIKNDF